MAQIVSPGPGWVDFAGKGRFEEASDVEVGIEATRFGPATIASIALRADGGVTDPGTYVLVGAELTLGDALAIVAALKPLIRQARLDGYDGYEGESELPERPDDWDSFEVALCGEKTAIFDDGTSAIERIDGREEFSDFDRYFYTVYGVHHAVEDQRTGETRIHSEPSLALVDIDLPKQRGWSEHKAEAIEIALDLAQGRPVYLLEDRTSTLVTQS